MNGSINTVRQEKIYRERKRERDIRVRLVIAELSMIIKPRLRSCASIFMFARTDPIKIFDA